MCLPMKNKLKIGIIGTRGIPNNYGGFEAFAEQVSQRLVTLGHEVTVYCSHDQQYRQKTLNGVHLVYCYNPESRIGSAGQFIYDLNCNLHTLKQRFDVILHLGYTSDSVWTRIWSRNARHLTNMDGMEWMRSKYAPAIRAFLKWAEKWAARRSNLLIADSRGILEHLQLNYSTPVCFISYGAAIPDSFDAAVPENFGVQPYQYDLLIARMEPENNIEMAVEAKLGEKPEFPLLIFSNETAYGKQLQLRYQREPMILFQGANYQVEAMNSLRHFSRYYIHGHSAGGTNPSLLEAMACGSVILAHDNIFNRSVLGVNCGYFRDAEQLTGLLNQPISQEYKHRTGENNLHIIRTHHNWEFITQEYESAFYQVLGY
jgi:glycosyltransferase involved in cell wall biosynthesis